MGGVVSGAKEDEEPSDLPGRSLPEGIPIAKTPSFHNMPSNVKVSGRNHSPPSSVLSSTILTSSSVELCSFDHLISFPF